MQADQIQATKYFRRTALIWLIFFFAGGETLQAQTDNYWSWNFNTTSILLAGAVVGGNAGASSIYYNPALTNRDNLPSLSLSANIISLQFFDAENIAGDGVDANKFLFKIQPRFISFSIPNKSRIGLEFGVLSPTSEEIRYSLDHYFVDDVIQRTQGLEQFYGYLKYAREYQDTWVGGGLSYEINKKFYVGGSSFLSIKRSRYEYRQRSTAFQNADTVFTPMPEAAYISTSSFEEEMRYWYLSMIFKVGLQYIFVPDRFSVGVNITLPDLPIFGEAQARKTLSRSNIYNDIEAQFVSNENLTLFENQLTTRVKNPFSIAAGVQYFTKSQKNSISLAGEYFHRIDHYAVVESDTRIPELPNYLDEALSDNDFMSYYYEARSVINLGLGFKQYVSEKFFFLGGFRTDFSAAANKNSRFSDGKFKINQIHMDKYHITAGPVLTVKKVRLITGIQYTRGARRDINQVVNYSNPVEFNPVTEQSLEGVRQKNVDATFNEISLFFGVQVLFREKEK